MFHSYASAYFVFCFISWFWQHRGMCAYFISVSEKKYCGLDLIAFRFFINEKIEDTAITGNSCSITFLFSWADVYCEDSGDETICACSDDKTNWRDNVSGVKYCFLIVF